MENPGSAEIRIVRRKKNHSGHHGGAWKVAFADFMTAMMAFFLVMWICGMDSNIKSAVEAYFKDPIAFKEAVSSGNAPFAISSGLISSNPEDGAGQPTITVQISEDSKELGALKSKIEKLIADTPEFKDLKEFVDIKLTVEGLQIELLEAKKSMFFDSGSALVKPKTRLLLLKLAKELQKVDNKIIVEGHTDALPLRRSDGYSNWDLSADRANGARRVLEQGNIKHGQIVQVRGMADNNLRDPEHPSSFANRRVSIVILYNKANSNNSNSKKNDGLNLPEVQKLDTSENINNPKNAEPYGTTNNAQAPLKTGTGEHQITVVTREGKVYKVNSEDITEGLIPKTQK